MQVGIATLILRTSRALAVAGLGCAVAVIGGAAAAQDHRAPRGTLVRPASAAVQPVEELPRAALQDGMELVDAEQIALAANPALGQAAARIEAARGKWVQAGLPPNPTWGYSGQQIGSRGVAEQDGVILGQEFVRGGKLRLSRSVAEREINRAEQDYAAQELRVLTDVRVAFYDVLIAQQRLDVNGELVKIGHQALHTADARFKAKDVSRIDVLQAKLETEQAKILLQNAHNRYDAAWRSLAAVMGRQSLPPQRLVGELSAKPFEFEWETSLQRLLGTSPEIASAVAEMERARWAVQRARVEAVPNINVQAIVQRDAQIRGTDGAIQITMPFPVFNRNQGGIRQAEGELIVAERALQLRPNLKVLYATGYTRNAIIHQGRLDADVELLTKPFTAGTLTRKVRAILDGKPSAAS